MARIIQTKWDDESDEKLKRLTAENLTAGEISARMPGRSRNSIIGRWHRLGLKGGKSQRSRKRVKAQPEQPPAPPAPKIHHPKPNFATIPGFLNPRRNVAPAVPTISSDDEPAPLMVPLIDLEPRMCKWAANDGDPFLFCGHATQSGQSYCDYHYKISVRGRPTPKLRRAA